MQVDLPPHDWPATPYQYCRPAHQWLTWYTILIFLSDVLIFPLLEGYVGWPATIDLPDTPYKSYIWFRHFQLSANSLHLYSLLEGYIGRPAPQRLTSYTQLILSITIMDTDWDSHEKSFFINHLIRLTLHQRNFGLYCFSLSASIPRFNCW